MLIKPMIRNNICINSHPAGCAQSVRNQIARAVKDLAGGTSPQEAAKAVPGTPKLALIIGCSTGYGLASRICAAFGYGAATVGVSFEKPASASKPGTPGFYNNLTFDAEAARAALPFITLDGDAFSGEMKERAIAAVRDMAKAAGIPAEIDLIIYSLASPVRTDPRDGTVYRSVIKPIGQPYSGKTIDMMSGAIITVSAEPASPEEIAHTIKVMGGEDWELWIDALDKAGLLAAGARTLAYTYIGPELSWAIYKNGTIGRAKEDLERAARAINRRFSEKASGGGAWVSVNKALVTRASAVIPIIPFYVSTLFKVMKERGLHEGCIEQIVRLYRDRLYAPGAAVDPALVPVDGEGRIRVDDREMREDVQRAVLEQMDKVSGENVDSATDIAGFRHDFLEAHGFDVAGVDYGRDVDPLIIV
ncbi:MAG: trans-2-enoyl-CoA reductase family protein [Treponema sp.]|jgi:enoyl-[acyl-carrier protein] reductase/trans-2-enoyl-CoA reductase (NAD+)|nr:trans-2-enoyl-CoA reductase family protein [Treponema sp.]